jgi:hypothetical protein
MVPYNDDSIGNGVIWVGDTSAHDVPRKIEEQLASIGSIAPDFHVMGFKKPGPTLGEPAYCTPYFHDWRDPKGKKQVQGGKLNDIIFDMTELRESAPYNSQTTADLFLRFKPEHGDVVVDWDENYQFYSALDAADLIDRGILCEPNLPHADGTLALVERRSQIALPIPSNSAIVWNFFGSGFGFEVFVMDGIALKRNMDLYPDYYAREDRTSDADVELDIHDCLEKLKKLQDGTVNPLDLANQTGSGKEQK